MRPNPQRNNFDLNLVRDFYRLPEQFRLIDSRESIPDEDRNRLVTRNAAIAIVNASGLDLYCVNEDSSPRVYKLIDYGKMRYDNQKREREQAKKQRENARTMKEIYFGPTTGDHDIEVKVRQIRELLEDHEVRIGVKLTKKHRFILCGRHNKPLQQVAQEEGFVLNKALKQLTDVIAPVKLNISEGSIAATLRKLQ